MQPPQQTQASSNHSPKIPSTSSLLFGFLISFLALFIIFMGCGLGSRYMVDRRRQRIALGSNQVRARAQGTYKPALWDVWTAPGHEKWIEMMPLSAEVRMHSPSLPPASPKRNDRTPSEQLLHLYQGFGRSGGRSLAPVPHRAPSHLSVPSSSRVSRSGTADEAVNLQLAVLVAMPSASRTSVRTSILKGKDSSLDGREHAQSEGDLPDVAMGVATIPWDKERMDFG